MYSSKRNTNLDVIRIVACFLVCSVHFFLNTGFYQQTVNTVPMCIYTVLRTGCMSCVPLFIILTGYLMNGKKPKATYYWGLEKTLLTYLLACIICLIYKLFVIKWNSNPITEILNFTAAPYAWYIEMYIGLFLMIPFLNIIWKGLTTKRQKQGLMLTLLFLTVLPSAVNIFNFSSAEWWIFPSLDSNYMKIMPAWWTALYPLTYYFTGIYLKEFPSRFRHGSVSFRFSSFCCLPYYSPGCLTVTEVSERSLCGELGRIGADCLFS